MAQVKTSNLVQQNEPRPLPRKSKILQSTQNTDRNSSHVGRVGNNKGAKFNFLQRSSMSGGSAEGLAVKPFDETPITVTNKSFSQILEEKLTDTIPTNTASSQLSKPKKPFLRKGEGLAKFQPKPYSCPSSVPKCLVTDYHVQHTKGNSETKNVTESKELRPVKPFLRKGSGLKRFRLKPVTGSRRNLNKSRKNCNQEANKCIEHPNWNKNSGNTPDKTIAQFTTNVESQQTVQRQEVKDTCLAVECSLQVNGKEYDGPSFTQSYEDKVQDESAELHAFELLEQQAANSSFSSNCSFVSRILQISSHSSFNVNHYGTEELQAHANFIPVDSVQNTSSTINTDIIKQYPELKDPLQCTKEQISNVARKIALLREDFFQYSDNRDDGDAKKVEQKSCPEVASFIQRISHLHKSVELKNWQENEADEETVKEKDSVTSNILDGGRQEQIEILIDELKEMKHCNSDTECSFLSETMCVRFAEDPYTPLEEEQTNYYAQKNTHSASESDKWGNSEFSSIDQEDCEINGSNKRVTPIPDGKHSPVQFEKEYHHTSDAHIHQQGNYEHLNLLKSDLLHKRLSELDMEISIYIEEKRKLCALRKEYEIIIQELLNEKETLKSLVTKERAAIKMEREEIAAQKFYLEQCKCELMKEKQILEGLKQLSELQQNIEEREDQIQSEHLRAQYLIKRLQRENSELKEELLKLKNSENLFKKSGLFVNRLKVGEKMKFINAVPNQMNGLKMRDVENSLEICDIVPKRCIPVAAHKNSSEVQLRKSLKGKREVSPVDQYNGDKKYFSKSAKQGSNKGKVINAASNHRIDLGNEDDENALVIHEVVPRKPLPSAVEDENEGNVDVHQNQLHAEKFNVKLIDTVPSKMRDCEIEECQDPLVACSNLTQHFDPSKTLEDAPEAQLHSAQNVAVAVTVPDNESIINSLLSKKSVGESNHFQTYNIQESAAVENSTHKNGNIKAFNDVGTNSLEKHYFSHHATQASSVTSGEFSADMNSLDDNSLITRDTITSKLHCTDKNVDPDMISSDRVTHIKTHPDGRKEIWYNNGCVCKVSSDGLTEKIIYYNGDVLERCVKSKTEKYYFCKSKIWCTTYEDKTQLVEFSNGQTELKKPDGTIKTNYTNGAAQTVFPDGRVEWVLNDGRQCTIERNGDKTWNFPNGQKEIHTKDHKRREYPDGTIKYVFPDGSMKTKYANGRIRVKDKYGKLLMDSDLQ